LAPEKQVVFYPIIVLLIWCGKIGVFRGKPQMSMVIRPECLELGRKFHLSLIRYPGGHWLTYCNYAYNLEIKGDIENTKRGNISTFHDFNIHAK